MATSWLHGPVFPIEVASLIGFAAVSWFRVVGFGAVPPPSGRGSNCGTDCLTTFRNASGTSRRDKSSTARHTVQKSHFTHEDGP
jgi:uncharacterized caspase-like protein